MKKSPQIETFTTLLWISFGLMGGISYYLKEEYLIFAFFLLVAVLHGIRLFKIQREKSRSRENDQTKCPVDKQK